MEENKELRAADFAQMREYRVDEEKQENEINVSTEYAGQHGAISCFYYAVLTDEAQKRLSGVNAVKLAELEDGKWKAVIYMGEERFECDFPEMDQLCTAHNIVICR